MTFVGVVAGAGHGVGRLTASLPGGSGREWRAWPPGKRGPRGTPAGVGRRGADARRPARRREALGSKWRLLDFFL